MGFRTSRKASHALAALLACGACASASAASCGGAKIRIADAPRPPPEVARVSLAPVAREGRLDVTRSPKLEGVTLGKVVIAFPREVAQHRGDVERSVRRALLERRIDVVVGEIRAKAGAGRPLPNKKGALSEAEELVVMGKETGADAILVFDRLGTAGFLYDVAIAWNQVSAAFEATPGAPGPSPAACPTGFRVKVPAFVATGRLVGAVDATILAEFDVKVHLLEDAAALGAPVDVVRTFPQEQRLQDTYQTSEGCSPEYYPYTYVAAWQPLDVLCFEVQKKLAPHIPPPDWKRLEPGVDAAVDGFVARVFGR